MLQTPSSKRWAQVVIAAFGLVAATVVVAMAARTPLSSSTPVDAASASAPATALFVLLLGAGVVALAALAVLMLQGCRSKRDDEAEPEVERPHIHWAWKLLAVLLPFALGAALIAAAVLGSKTLHTAPGPARSGHPVRPVTHHAAGGTGGTGFVLPAWLPWAVLAILLAAVAVGAVLLVRRQRGVHDEPPEHDAARAAVQAAIGSLDTTTDPRSAVIAAYVAMEGTFAAHGFSRSPTEAPREFLRRLLTAGSAADGEARALTGLFEEARFSEHPIPERVRTLALSALSSLRARLKVEGPL